MATGVGSQPSDPAAALQMAQRASSILAQAAAVKMRFPASMLSAADSTELWNNVEQLLYACLRTGDDRSAFLCVEQLTERFGATNERVMALRGLYQEAVAADDAALRKILEDYTKILMENPMNVPIHKRRIALIRSLGRPQDAITELAEFVDSFPTDVEAWCELSDLYQSQGCLAQAIFSLEEAMLTAPHAWNLHARLGELEYMVALAAPGDGEQQHLVQAIQRFSRSVELCDDYVRGLYGLKLASDKLSTVLATTKTATATMTPETAQKLGRLATSKLETVIQERAASHSPAVDQAATIAAQGLLNRSKP